MLKTELTPPLNPAMQDLPLVSVLVPIYNVQRYLEEALNSISRQTYSNLEIIVIDDCSTDETYAIAKTFAARDPRFKVHRNAVNQRIAETLNRALSLATGDLIARCDGDDIMEIDRIERQYKYLLKHPSISLVGCSIRTINEHGEHLRDVRYPQGPSLIVKLLPFCNPVAHIWLAKRKIYDEVGNYRIASVEDYDFLLRATRAGFEVDNIEDYFGMQMRVRTDNTVGRYGIVQRRLFNFAKSINLDKNTNNSAKLTKDEVKELSEKYSEGIIAKLHYQSDRLSSRAAFGKSKALRYFWHIAAALTSPFKMQYYVNIAFSEFIKIRHKR